MNERSLSESSPSSGAPIPAHPALTRRGRGVSADGEFFMPTRVFFGRGVSGHIAEHVASLGFARVMVVSDPGVAQAGLLEPVIDRLRKAGIAVATFTQVETNPRDVDCLLGVEFAREASRDAFIAVGGGSAIDSAKCISLIRMNGGHPRDWEDFGALQCAPLPVVAIPTTAGTGSEVSPSAVITDTERRKKMNLFDVRNFPQIALVDPDLTFSCPPSQTAASGMDALSHALDSLQCRLATPASDALALEGARLVGRYLRRAYATGDDIEARAGVAQGSLAAGIAVGLTDVSGAHCLAEAIGGLYGHPHGFCCAASMPPIMEYNSATSSDKYARFAEALGITRDGHDDHAMTDLAISFVRQLNRDLDVPPMDELIRVEDVDQLGRKAAANTSRPSNPVDANATDFCNMFVRELANTRSGG